MSYRVEWSATSVSDLSEHVAFLKKVSQEAATKITATIISMAESLAEFPERCPEFSMPHNFPVPIRKCVVESRYNLLFGVHERSIMIYRVLDARRNFDGLLS